MLFEKFCAEHFNNDQEKALCHLAHESYYKDYSLTGSSENLQAILNALPRKEANRFMRYFRKEVSNNPAVFHKAMATVNGASIPWQYDDEFIKKGNPYGKKVKRYSIISILGILAVLVLFVGLKATGVFEEVRELYGCIGASFITWTFANLFPSILNYFEFKKAEKRIAAQLSEKDSKEE